MSRFVIPAFVKIPNPSRNKRKTYDEPIRWWCVWCIWLGTYRTRRTSSKHGWLSGESQRPYARTESLNPIRESTNPLSRVKCREEGVCINWFTCVSGFERKGKIELTSSHAEEKCDVNKRCASYNDLNNGMLPDRDYGRKNVRKRGMRQRTGFMRRVSLTFEWLMVEDYLVRRPVFREKTI